MRVELENVKVAVPKSGPNAGQPVVMKTAKSSGNQYAEFTVMESSSRKDQAGQWENGPTIFIRCRVHGYAAQDVYAALMGGVDRVDVKGDLEHFLWQSQQGPKDTWDIGFARVSLPVPRTQQQSQGGGWSGGGSQPAQQGAWDSAPQGGFDVQGSEPPF
ncbi:single-stranded DNA-binding protein [Corynebacterium provencense]|uniref:single-stranded DNA-binding protein n=1 Tax=Corynebacterium provencense TaxID=1737425 RepID=UPI0008321A6D|nr:single-stranded DNA-binding protein [Corynebacterium provencense]